MQVRKRAYVQTAAASPPSPVASGAVRASNGTSTVQWCSPSACRTINATALVAWTAGMCVGELWLHAACRETHAWHSYEASNTATILGRQRLMPHPIWSKLKSSR
jgi:hypothetical protein